VTGSGREGRRKRRAALVTSAFLAIGPGVVAGVIPWRLTHWKVPYPVPGGPGARAVGLVLIGGGAAVLVHSFVRFVVEGVGTPVPVAPDPAARRRRPLPPDPAAAPSCVG